jgi:hypothetical protein
MTRTLLAVAVCLLAAGCDDPVTQGDAPKRQHERNVPSIGLIDIPAKDATVDPSVRVSGWACDDSGVKSVRIFFDDELMLSVPLVSARPDVEKVYPRCASTDHIHGFESLIDAGAHVGYTNIRAEVIDSKGGVTQLPPVSVKIRE